MQPSEDRRARERLVARIKAQEERKQRARRRKADGIWFGVGTFGMVGWSIAIPTLLGIALGLWLDAQSFGRVSWALTLMIGGVILGCLNAWYWVSREQRAITRDDGEDEHELE